MVKQHLTVIAYDISDNRKRSQVSSLLEGYGERANLSVFECMLSARQLELLIPQLASAIDPKTDSILVYRICKSCYGKALRIGTGLDKSGAIKSV